MVTKALRSEVAFLGSELSQDLKWVLQRPKRKDGQRRRR